MRLIALVRRSAAQALPVLLGGMVLFFAFQFLLISQAAEISRSQGFGRVAELIPAFLQRGLGGQALLLATFNGTVAFGYFHPIVLCSISLIAMYLATEPAHEIESGLVDITLARPLPRHRLITRSLLLAMGSTVALALLMMAGTFTGLRWLAPDAMPPSRSLIARLALHLAVVTWCCAAIGIFIATCSKRWTTAFTAAAAYVIVGYLVDFLAIGWPPARTLAWAFPFHYFPALDIVGGAGASGRNLGVLLGATFVFSALSYWRFQRRDL